MSSFFENIIILLREFYFFVEDVFIYNEVLDVIFWIEFQIFYVYMFFVKKKFRKFDFS